MLVLPAITKTTEMRSLTGKESKNTKGQNKSSKMADDVDERSQQTSPLGPVHWIPSIYSPVLSDDARPGSSYTNYGAQSLYMAQDDALELYDSDIGRTDMVNERSTINEKELNKHQRRNSMVDSQFYQVNPGGAFSSRQRRLSSASSASSGGQDNVARILRERNSSGTSNISASSSLGHRSIDLVMRANFTNFTNY